MITVQSAQQINTGFEMTGTAVLVDMFWKCMKAADEFGEKKQYGFERGLNTVCKLIDMELFKRNSDTFEWASHVWGSKDFERV